VKQHLIPIILGLLILSPVSADGHELWFEAGADGLVLMRGHELGHLDHGQPATPCAPGELQRATIVHPDGTRLDFDPATAFPESWPETAAALSIAVSSGIWTKTPTGTVNRARTETRSPLSSWLSLEGIKYIGSWRPELAHPLDDGLEISPQANPLEMKKGHKLEILVTIDRQPVPGVVVTYAGKPRGVTGPGGTINIRLKEKGPQTIAATLVRSEPTEKYDQIIATATLVFHLE
jgi:nickel transport protein